MWEYWQEMAGLIEVRKKGEESLASELEDVLEEDKNSVTNPRWRRDGGIIFP